MLKIGSSLTKSFLLVILIVRGGWSADAQSATDRPKQPESVPPADESIADLNFLGVDVAPPPLSDSLVDVDSSYRRAMFRHGMALRFFVYTQYVQNALHAPVGPDKQVYIGERPFEYGITQPVFTADLRQLHLHNAQLNMSGVWYWASWGPAGPKTIQLWTLYLYKAFAQNRVEIKMGYNSNDLEFIGLPVGGSIASAVQGVYATLPYEVGMAYFPLTAPSSSVRVQGPENTYFKADAQRSIDATGGPATVARDHTGFRFIPHGDKLLLVGELGYHRVSNRGSHETWFRSGYMRNSTPYSNAISGKKQAGNFCAYVLTDYQLRQRDQLHPNHGLYFGGSAMTVPETLNPYSRYYEARFYQEAPFLSRPNDVVSVVASHTGYSKYFINNFIAGGETVWRSSTSLTGSYSLRVSGGNYVSLGLSYIYGPAIAPRVSNALNFEASWNLFF
jgi:porin